MPYVQLFEFRLRHNFPKYELIIRTRALFTEIMLENSNEFLELEEYWIDHVCEFYFTFDEEKVSGKIIVDLSEIHITTEKFPCIYSFRIGMIKKYIKSKVDGIPHQQDTPD